MTKQAITKIVIAKALARLQEIELEQKYKDDYFDVPFWTWDKGMHRPQTRFTTVQGLAQSVFMISIWQAIHEQVAPLEIELALFSNKLLKKDTFDKIVTSVSVRMLVDEMLVDETKELIELSTLLEGKDST